MNTTIKDLGDETVALFEGRLDTAAAQQTEKDVQPLLGCKNRTIVLDCSKLEYISSSGLRIFLAILKATKPQGCKVCITGMNADIKNVFSMTGFNNLFEFR